MYVCICTHAYKADTGQCACAGRLVVVLERRTLVHDLKTLELLRTVETPSNPKVTRAQMLRA